MKLSNASLKWKLLLIILGFSALIILVFYMFQILFLDSIYKNTKIDHTKSTMNEVYQIVNGCDVNSLSDPNSSLYNKLNEYMDDKEVNIYIVTQEPIFVDKFIVDFNYHFTFPYTSNGNDIINRIISKPLLTHVYNNIPEIGARFVIFNDDQREEFRNIITEEEKDLTGENIIYCQKVKVSNQIRLLVIYSRMTPVQPAIDTLKTQFFYIAFFVILITIIVVFLISRSISKPIIDITAAAKTLAKGDYDTEFTGSGFKEIKELSDTLNYAAIELKKTENLQRELIANVSHDLRTPLTLITGYAEMIRDFPGEDSSENVKIIIEEANRLKVLVSDLLVLSRISANTETFTITTINITDTIISIINRQQKILENQNFVITFDYKEKINIEADFNKMEQVIYNFISNAVNYSGDSKKIEISQEVKDDIVTIKVKDYGIGIKKEDMEFIWDRYYRVDKGLKRSSQGSGLGLSIIKGILDYHKFTYGVDSTLGEGSTFYFSAKVKK